MLNLSTSKTFSKFFISGTSPLENNKKINAK